MIGAHFVYDWTPSLLAKTGGGLAVSSSQVWQVIVFAVLVSTLGACAPGVWASSLQPADIIGENG
jgi:hypothetical protein